MKFRFAHKEVFLIYFILDIRINIPVLHTGESDHCSHTKQQQPDCPAVRHALPRKEAIVQGPQPIGTLLYTKNKIKMLILLECKLGINILPAIIYKGFFILDWYRF